MSTEGVGGQKSQKLVNIICECPLVTLHINNTQAKHKPMTSDKLITIKKKHKSMMSAF